MRGGGRHHFPFSLISLLFSASLLLAACGGGGGASSAPATNTTGTGTDTGSGQCSPNCVTVSQTLTDANSQPFANKTLIFTPVIPKPLLDFAAASKEAVLLAATSYTTTTDANGFYTIQLTNGTTYAVMESITGATVGNITVTDTDGNGIADASGAPATAQVITSAGTNTGTNTGTVAPPAAPGSPSATPGDAQIVLSWTAVTDASYYKIYRSNAADTPGTLAAISTSASLIVAADNGTTYYYTITSVNTGGESAASSAVSATAQGPAPVSVNQAPTVTLASAALAFTEGGGPVAIDSALSLADADSANLTGASVWISGNFTAAEDVLLFTNTIKITGSWNAATGVLTISGTATKAEYQAFLRSVTFNDTSANPNLSSRTISMKVTDGVADSAVVTRTVTMTAVDNAPTVANAPANISQTESGNLAAPVTGDGVRSCFIALPQ